MLLSYDADRQIVTLTLVNDTPVPVPMFPTMQYDLYKMTLWEYEQWFGFRAAVDLVRETTGTP